MKQTIDVIDITKHVQTVPEIKVKYITDVEPIQKIEVGDWIDLRCAVSRFISKGTFDLIPLGVAIQLPEGYEAHLVPRSSTFKTHKIIQTNSMGIIDESYCGDDDEWMMPVYAIEDTVINKNARICQFRIVPKMPKVCITTVESLGNKSRGGFGSTGVN